MSFMVVIGILAVVLFLIVFVTKRRFGMLGLALAAGSVISTMVATEVAVRVQQAGIQLTAPPLESVVVIVITLTPPLLLLRSAGKYNGLALRIIGGILFALTAVSLMLGAIQSGLVIDGYGRIVYDNLSQYRGVIIAGALMYAIGEVFLAKSHKPSKDAAKH